MLVIRSFINLIVVPSVAFCLLYAKKNLEIRFSFKALMHYCIMTACNIPVTRALTFVFRLITGKSIEAEDSYYTIAALLAAVSIPYIYKMWGRVRLYFQVEKKAGI